MDSSKSEQSKFLAMRDPEQLLDVSQAAALLCLKPKTLYAWVSRNKIPYRKLNSLVRSHRGELVEWSKRRMVQ